MGLLGTLAGHGLNLASQHLQNSGHGAASSVMDAAIGGHSSRGIRQCVQDRRFERSSADVKVRVIFQRGY